MREHQSVVEWYSAKKTGGIDAEVGVGVEVVFGVMARHGAGRPKTPACWPDAVDDRRHSFGLDLLFRSRDSC